MSATVPKRTAIAHLLFFAILLPAALAAQHTCGMRAPGAAAVFGKAANSPRAIDSRPGAHLPTEGTIRGLVVFVQSKDDNLESAQWENGSLPSWSGEFIGELQNYYQQTSGGKLDLQLDLYPEYYIPELSELDYIERGERYGDFIKDMLADLDKKMSFEKYDGWQTVDRTFRPRQGTDGTVDLLMVIHRSIKYRGFMPHTGVADLMFKGNFYVDGMQRNFYGGTGYNNDAGASGLIVAGYPGHNHVLDYSTAFRITLHEMQHKLLSDVHTTDSFAGLGVMSANASGVAMCAIERHFMGFLDIPMLDFDADTVLTLRDYVSTDDALAIPVQQHERYYYILEYRAKTHPHDTAPERGLFIYRVDDNWSPMEKTIMVMTADGQWQWRVDEETGRIERADADALGGYNPLQKIIIGGKPYWHPEYGGYEGIAFTPQRSPLGMYRNPTGSFILRKDTIFTNLTVTVLEMDGQQARVSVTHTPPAILDTDKPEESGFGLGAAYPNPVSSSQAGTVSIPFSLAQSADATLSVYDALGRTVFTATRTGAAPGRHSVRVPVSALAPGSYFYRLQTPAGARHKKFLITN